MATKLEIVVNPKQLNGTIKHLIKEFDYFIGRCRNNDIYQDLKLSGLISPCRYQ